ncbi:MAG: (deoxy)nucleoside triphosphate pyrophosphohydrolase [Planctomycetes bacterium]|nr:(deoxy)nucleoside triphosphate pyrophosphohydrolase [Planctomycetota bacterium]MBI3846043.1 (deoxy)nucleoside triphosphate pyrophosphohydrolase [Planctomycetota bacterium]
MSAPLEIALALIESEGRYLVARRPPGVPLEGAWEFPGGKREPGESLEDCARREVREEIGVDVQVGALRAVVHHAYPDRSVLLHFFDCSIVSGKPVSSAGGELRWASVDEMGVLPIPEANRTILSVLTRTTRT